MDEGHVTMSSSVECDLSNKSDHQRTENTANYLTVTEKGKFKWNGLFEDLKTFMDELTGKETKWSTPSGHCKLLELDEVVVRWYSNSNSLTINGKLSEDIKTQLRIVAKLTRADTEVINNVDNEAVCNGEQISTNPSTKELKDELEMVLDTVWKVEERLELRINNIASEIHETRIELYNEKMARGENEAINKSMSNQSSSVFETQHSKENVSLKAENDRLKDQICNYKCIVSDLNSKVKDLENEKNSLIAVVKILQNDQEQHEASWNVVNNHKKTTGGPNSLPHNPSDNKNDKENYLQLRNQFIVLSDGESYSDNSAAMSAQQEVNQGTNEKPEQRKSHQSKRANTSHSRSKVDTKKNDKNKSTTTKQRHSNIAVLGDSMLKHLNPRRIQHGIDHKVTIKTFPGAGVDEMIHYVRPTLQKNPNHVILHVGTNDLQSKSPDTLITAISKLGEVITKEGRGTELTLSEIITRNDDALLADKVNIYNKKLDNLCTERNWGLIKHNNITKSHLNNYGLHLNQRGTTTFAMNLKYFLKIQTSIN